MADSVTLVSVPITGWQITLEALRDFVEATDGEPEAAVVQVYSDELRYERKTS